MIEAAFLAAVVADSRARAISREAGALAEERERSHELALARTRWLERHDAEASFPCGVTRPELPVDEGEATRRSEEVHVIAAVLPGSVVFLVEPPAWLASPDPIEAGAIRRDAIRTVDVVDRDGQPVPEPATEPFDPEPEVELVVWWDGDPGEPGEPGEQRLTFRSSWLAWQATKRLRDLATP
jgi:hypothetical protein